MKGIGIVIAACAVSLIAGGAIGLWLGSVRSYFPRQDAPATLIQDVNLTTGAKVVVRPAERCESQRSIDKTVESSKLRLVFVVGLEGTGHHFFVPALGTLFEKGHTRKGLPLPYIDSCRLARQFFPGLVPSLSASRADYQKALQRVKTEMGKLAAKERRISSPGTIVMLQPTKSGHLCPQVGVLSYPKNGGKDKVMHYIDLTIMAEAAESAGVDLRVVFLSRSARDLIISNTEHRAFQWGYPGGDDASAEEAYMHYLNIMLTDAAALHSMMAELDPAFIVCHRYDMISNAEQAWMIANFTAPSQELSAHVVNALLSTAQPAEGKDVNDDPHVGDEESFEERAADKVLVNRLQRKLDLLDRTFCSHQHFESGG